MKSVKILMSVYNGEQYIEEQLLSIFNQSYKNISVLIRDDGSKDNTTSIIKKYLNQNLIKIELIEEENIGARNSFFRLINYTKLNSDYYAFCDQDDFWEKDKIEKAIRKIDEIEDEYVTYFSNLKIVDEKLNFLKIRYNKKLKPSFENSLIENIMTGCTIVATKKMFEKFKNEKIDKVLMHDWYIYILSNIFGKIIYDEISYIKYRQHSNNVIGMETNIVKKIIKRIKNVIKYRGKRMNQIKEIYLNYNGLLNEKNREYIEVLINDKNFFIRFKNCLNIKFFKQNKNEVFLTKILYMIKGL